MEVASFSADAAMSSVARDLLDELSASVRNGAKS
jgi:hypothetical protein